MKQNYRANNFFFLKKRLKKFFFKTLNDYQIFTMIIRYILLYILRYNFIQNVTTFEILNILKKNL